MGEYKENIAILDYKNREDYKIHRKVLENFEKMSRQEKIQTLIDSGIYNENLELTERYGGKAQNSSKETTGEQAS